MNPLAPIIKIRIKPAPSWRILSFVGRRRSRLTVFSHSNDPVPYLQLASKTILRIFPKWESPRNHHGFPGIRRGQLHTGHAYIVNGGLLFHQIPSESTGAPEASA